MAKCSYSVKTLKRSASASKHLEQSKRSSVGFNVLTFPLATQKCEFEINPCILSMCQLKIVLNCKCLSVPTHREAAVKGRGLLSAERDYECEVLVRIILLPNYFQEKLRINNFFWCKLTTLKI